MLILKWCHLTVELTFPLVTLYSGIFANARGATKHIRSPTLITGALSAGAQAGDTISIMDTGIC